MKYSRLLVLTFMVGLATLYGAPPPEADPRMPLSSEQFSSKILKVYSSREGDLEFVAYVVSWKQQEVVIIPSGALGDSQRYKVGDTVRCLLQQKSVKVGDTTKRQVIFSIFDPHMLSATPESEQQRLDAVKAAYERRKELRDAAERQIRASPQQPNKSLQPTPGSVTPRASEGISK